MGYAAHMTAPRLEQLRAARLHRQRAAADVDALVRETIGLHSTDYATPYLSSWARVTGFDPSALADRLHRADGLVRINAMRNTVHVVHVRDLPLIIAACGPAVSAVGRRALKDRSDAALDAGVDALVAALADGPRSTNEIKAALPSLGPDVRSWLLVAMGRGVVLRADAPHLRSNRNRYARTVDRVPGLEPVPAAEARRTLLVRAVEAFGPLTVDDLAWWLPAPKGEVARALASGTGLAQLEADGRTYWYAGELADAPAPARETHGAWLLPYEDALLKGTLDRSAWLAPGLRPVLFPFNATHWHPETQLDPGPGPHGGANVSGEARPSVWWGGRAVGRWEERDGGVVHRLHADVGAEGRAAIEADVERLDAFFARSGLSRGR